MAIINLWAWGRGHNEVLEAAYAIPDGGGYCSLADTGVSQAIRHNGSLILSASKGGTYCSGFTFEVAMKVAAQRGLIANKSVSQVRKFQAEWFGATKNSAQKQSALAVTNLGIGREISPPDAQPGDFICFNRTYHVGHSVVFLNWIYDGTDKAVGFRYRSSQSTTNGVADNFEYFADTGGGRVDRNTVHVARLNFSVGGRILHPLG